MEQHYAEPISLDTLAGEVHLSRSYISEIFRKEMEQTLIAIRVYGFMFCASMQVVGRIYAYGSVAHVWRFRAMVLTTSLITMGLDRWPFIPASRDF